MLKGNREEHFTGNLCEICKMSDECIIPHKIQMEGLISPEVIETLNHTIFGRRIETFDDEQFGRYCKFTISLMKKGDITSKIRITITDASGKTFVKKPKRYTDLSKQDCVVFSWKGDGFYDCNRTYFHFEDDEENTTGEADFMHYKCKLTKVLMIRN